MTTRLLKNLVRALALGAVAFALSGCEMALMSPKGDVGLQQKNLILIATGLMLLVVVPVIVLSLYFAWKYRASNQGAEYRPEWSHSTAIEVVVWAVPCAIIAILGVITWKTSHSLDPYRPLESEVRPIRVQAVSLDWKWLFIYPDYGVASVNELAFPVDTPLSFRITSDTVMNAFFIPALGSQIYSMAGMETQLHLNAREQGVFPGFSSNYSGSGFSGMRFSAIATTPEGFEQWVAKARASTETLDAGSYAALAKPSEHDPVRYYTAAQPELFNQIVMKYMGHEDHEHGFAGSDHGLPMCRTPVAALDGVHVSAVTE